LKFDYCSIERPGAVFFNAGSNEEVLSKLRKNVGRDPSCRFREKRKNAQLRHTSIPKIWRHRAEG